MIFQAAGLGEMQEAKPRSAGRRDGDEAGLGLVNIESVLREVSRTLPKIVPNVLINKREGGPLPPTSRNSVHVRAHLRDAMDSSWRRICRCTVFIGKCTVYIGKQPNPWNLLPTPGCDAFQPGLFSIALQLIHLCFYQDEMQLRSVRYYQNGFQLTGLGCYQTEVRLKGLGSS